MSETRVNAVGFTDVRTAHQDLHSAQGPCAESIQDVRGIQ